MDKTGKENIKCVFCQREALPDTDPPVCEEHRNNKTASAERRPPQTLKELEAQVDR